MAQLPLLVKTVQLVLRAAVHLFGLLAGPGGSKVRPRSSLIRGWLWQSFGFGMQVAID